MWKTPNYPIWWAFPLEVKTLPRHWYESTWGAVPKLAHSCPTHGLKNITDQGHWRVAQDPETCQTTQDPRLHLVHPTSKPSLSAQAWPKSLNLLPVPRLYSAPPILPSSCHHSLWLTHQARDSGEPPSNHHTGNHPTGSQSRLQPINQ